MRPKVTTNEIRQVLVALVAALTAAASMGLLPDPWGKYVAVLAAAVGGATVWPPSTTPDPVPPADPLPPAAPAALNDEQVA